MQQAHKGEDEKVLSAHRKILETHPTALLILVPRHPERFDSVYKLCMQEKLITSRRSTQPIPQPQDQIFLGDSMGEMAFYFQIADISFMGGSFVTVGGHNLLEPAALAKATLIGPHYFNFTDITQQLVTRHACLIVENEVELATQVIRLFNDSSLQQQMGMAGFDVVTANQGALNKSLDAVHELL